MGGAPVAGDADEPAGDGDIEAGAAQGGARLLSGSGRPWGSAAASADSTARLALALGQIEEAVQREFKRLGGVSRLG
jgi:hypothetical protein